MFGERDYLDTVCSGEQAKRLVPPYWVCSQINPGIFNHTVWVWADCINGETELMLRRAAQLCWAQRVFAPAPNLEEFMAVMGRISPDPHSEVTFSGSVWQFDFSDYAPGDSYELITLVASKYIANHPFPWSNGEYSHDEIKGPESTISQVTKQVPTMDICRKLQGDYLQDTAWVWAISDMGNAVLMLRNYADSSNCLIVAPAPTLQEILEAMAKSAPEKVSCRYENSEWIISFMRNKDERSDNAAQLAALIYGSYSFGGWIQ